MPSCSGSDESHQNCWVALSDQIVGQSLMLECNVTTVIGITSGVVLVWCFQAPKRQTRRRRREPREEFSFLLNMLLCFSKDEHLYGTNTREQDMCHAPLISDFLITDPHFNTRDTEGRVR